ncbi:MAG: hypothetical protein MUE47_05780 [Acidobacteria bacterium]|jgi:hypothetical protein|nr:hypothetical protein [Acidobacteriota bacterium]
MATNLALGPRHLNQALAVSGEETKRTAVTRAPEVLLVDPCLLRSDVIVTIGIVLQELLSEFREPTAALRNHCGRCSIHLRTSDAQLAQL